MIKIAENTSSLSKESLIETNFFNATIITSKEDPFLNFSTTIFEEIAPKIRACLKIFYKGSAKRNLVFESHDFITDTINDVAEKKIKSFVEAVILAVDKVEKMGLISYIMVNNSYSAVFRKCNKNYPVK